MTVFNSICRVALGGIVAAGPAARARSKDHE
jgi:hypothetical protein